jgi:hypothetical protein
LVTGIITNQIIQQLFISDLVVADLSFWNANVFYELAFRHTIKKPTIHMIRKDERLPFDIQGSRTIYFNLSDLDDVEYTKETLSKQIEIVENKKVFDNPITTSFDINELKNSEKPLDKIMIEMIDNIKEIRLELQEIKNYNRTPSRNLEKHNSYLIDPSFAKVPDSVITNINKIPNVRIANID